MSPSRTSPGFDSRRNAFARLTAGATFVLVFAGGLVTSTGSALAVPDWPLSFGQLFPPMVGGVFYEHGHRMIAGTVAVLTAILAVWTWTTEARRWVRRLAAAALAAVIVQALLGGMTVLFLLPTPISVAHACLGQVFFCLTVTLALVTGTRWLEAEPRRLPADAPFPGTPAAITTAALFLQLAIGAVMRHTGAGLAIPDFPLAFGRWIPELATTGIAVHFLHRVWALVVFTLICHTALTVGRHHRDQALLVRPAIALTALVTLQIALGAAIIWTGKAPFPTTAHVALGAALLATSLVLTLRSHRSFVREAPAIARRTHAVRSPA